MEDRYIRIIPKQEIPIIYNLRNEGQTLQEIANRYGVSRERIRQILRNSKSRKTTNPQGCLNSRQVSKQFGMTPDNLGMFIRNHNLILSNHQKGKRYFFTSEDVEKIKQIRSSMYRAPKITFNCEWCGQEKTIRYLVYKRNKFHFCSRRCHGLWLGNNYGRKREKRKKEEGMIKKYIQKIWQLFRFYYLLLLRETRKE